MNIRNFGLIGFPLSHSFSPGYFSAKFKREEIENCSYDLYPLEDISMVERLMNSGLQGLNVTIPYKEKVIPYLSDLSEEAKAIGAVNTIKIVADKRIGFNTDVYGFEISLLNICGGSVPKTALILGSGGASKAVRFVLEKHNCKYKIVSRTNGDLKYQHIDQEVLESHQLIVNTTPLGMYPNIDNAPDLPYQFCNSNHVFYDLVYNPEKTLFLKKGEIKGCKIKNGLEMLELQAERAWQIWND